MKRLTIVVMHLVALPVATLLSLAVVIVLPPMATWPAVDIPVHDTYYVIGHFDTAIFLGSWVLLTTVVALRYRSLNWLLGVAWACFLAHIIATLVPWPLPHMGSSDSTFDLRPLRAISALFNASVILGCLTTSLGLLLSLVRALHSARQAA